MMVPKCDGCGEVFSDEYRPRVEVKGWDKSDFCSYSCLSVWADKKANGQCYISTERGQREARKMIEWSAPAPIQGSDGNG